MYPRNPHQQTQQAPRRRIRRGHGFLLTAALVGVFWLWGHGLAEQTPHQPAPTVHATSHVNH